MAQIEIIKIDENNLENPCELKKLERAGKIIRNGGLVVFPTETVYGLGANAFDESAVKKIYEIKGRPSDNPLIVHFADPEDIYKYAEVPDIAEKIIKKFMPAPLTLVLKKKGNEFDSSCKLDTVAVRVPKNNTARKLIELAGVPITAPSANLSGKPSPTNAAHIMSDLDGKVDMIICGENCEIGLESTVISFNGDGIINILRSGYITRDDLISVGARIARPGTELIEQPRAPGMKYKHYSPDAPLYILSGENDRIIDFMSKELCRKTKKVGFLCFAEMLSFFADNKNIISISLGLKNDLKEQAKNLFSALNKFNELGVDIIYSVEPEKTGVGEAIYNRLIKAAGGKTIIL
ncbi:MAG: L-threonylcarbamoyladenylate synthase [Oscillospiraceae bacterium]|nr:L-threonylcarbamoyladenylate synthase [Oscillospiraceae bacterium]